MKSRFRVNPKTNVTTWGSSWGPERSRRHHRVLTIDGVVAVVTDRVEITPWEIVARVKVPYRDFIVRRYRVVDGKRVWRDMAQVMNALHPFFVDGGRAPNGVSI